MKVYVVFHADIEDDRYVRAVCSTRERAEAIANTPTPCDESHDGFTDPRFQRHLRQYVNRYPDPADAEPADEWNCYGAHDHFTRGGTRESLCCTVDEWEVDGITPDAHRGPGRPQSVTESVTVPWYSVARWGAMRVDSGSGGRIRTYDQAVNSLLLIDVYYARSARRSAYHSVTESVTGVLNG